MRAFIMLDLSEGDSEQMREMKKQKNKNKGKMKWTIPSSLLLDIVV